MLKIEHYFPHPANFRNDRRMKRAMKDFPGAVGYGIIVWLFERLRVEKEFQYPIQDLDLLADELDVSLPILQTIINKYDFFKIIESNNGEVFISPLLNDLMLPYLEKVEKNRIAGKISAEKRKKKQLEQLKQLSVSNSSQHMYNGCSTKKEEEKKEEEKKEYLSFEELRFYDFKKFLIKEYAGKLTFKFPYPNDLNLLEHTIVSLKSNGYLFNQLIGKDFTIEQAKGIWDYIYENRICLIKSIKKEK